MWTRVVGKEHNALVNCSLQILLVVLCRIYLLTLISLCTLLVNLSLGFWKQVCALCEYLVAECSYGCYWKQRHDDDVTAVFIVLCCQLFLLPQKNVICVVWLCLSVCLHFLTSSNSFQLTRQAHLNFLVWFVFLNNLKVPVVLIWYSNKNTLNPPHLFDLDLCQVCLISEKKVYTDSNEFL